MATTQHRFHSSAHGAFAGLELLSSAVVLVDERLVIRYLNPGAENLFAVSHRKMVGLPLANLLGEPTGLGAASARVTGLHRPGSEILRNDTGPSIWTAP